MDDMRKVAKSDRRAHRRQKRVEGLKSSIQPLQTQLSSAATDDRIFFSTPEKVSTYQPMETDEEPPRDLVRDLGLVALNHNMTQKCLEDVMKVLREHGVPNLPMTARCVFARTMTTLQFPVETDNFLYIGIAEGLKYVLGAYPQARNVTVNFSTDGLPLSKSSSQKIWPLMMSTNVAPGTVSVVAVCYGESDPSPTKLLSNFIEELNQLLLGGYSHNDRNIEIQFGYFVSDLPALALVKCIKGHAGYYSCPKCNIEGIENWLMFTKEL